MSRSTKKITANKSQESGSEGCMCALMATAKMVMRFAETRIAKHKQFSNLTGPRMGVLFNVHAAGSIRMGDLASKLLVAPRTVTDLVDGLEREGFLHRIPDPNDRRAFRLELTTSAKADFEKIVGLRSAFVEEIFSDFSEQEKAQLIKLLIKLREGPLSELVQGQKSVTE